MRDIDRALADLADIRGQLAAGAAFRGFGSLVIAATGGLALLTATAQSVFDDALAAQQGVFLACWIGTAVVCAVMIGAEMWALAHRHHGALAGSMIANAVEQFLPTGVAGAALTFVALRFAPDTVWMLPGLWQVLIAVALCGAVRTLPPAILFVSAWYLAAGLTALAIASVDRTLTPWLMGGPFFVGQLATAVILRRAEEASDVGV